MTRDGCPDPSVLHRYIDQPSDPQPGDPIAAHLAACPHCRSLLEGTTAEVDVLHWRELWAIGNQCKSPDENAAIGEDGHRHRDLPPPGSIQVEGFEILDILGRGGSGVVYKARQIKLDRLVALKMLTAGAHASPRALARFREESKSIARLGHPQVVAIHDVGEDLGIPYLCLELVEGGSLADRLSGEPLPPHEAARLTAGLARIVQDAHDRGVVHRDLKPANVLVSGSRDRPLDPGRLKLTDFGLAKRLDQDGSSQASVSGVVLGTPSYMAPEQAMSRSTTVGPAVDVYGLGAILYELLTGRPPFRGESPMETVFQVVGQTPVPPSRINDQVPDGLEAVCLRCLEKEPNRRFPTARDLADELERLSTEQPGIPLSHRARHRWRLGPRAPLKWGFAALLVLGCSGLVGLRFSGHRHGSQPLPEPVLKVVAPDVSCHDQGMNQLAGCVVMTPPLDAYGARSKVINFDLEDDKQKDYLDASMTSNARIWHEDRHSVSYWAPVDASEWCRVGYKIELDFPVVSATLFADIELHGPGAQGELEVSSDARPEWTTISRQAIFFPGHGPIDVSDIVRGARVVYVRAKMRGRYDGDQSYLAQFLRTSTLPNGHLENKRQHVFELRAYDRDVPILTGEVKFDDDSWQGLWIAQDGEYRIVRDFTHPGRYLGTVRVRAGKTSVGAKPFELWINTPGWLARIESVPARTHLGERYRAEGQLVAVGNGPWSGVVDYGDRSGERPLAIDLNGSFRLDHAYPAAGHYRIRVTISDQDGGMVSKLATCIMDPAGNLGIPVGQTAANQGSIQ